MDPRRVDPRVGRKAAHPAARRAVPRVARQVRKAAHRAALQVRWVCLQQDCQVAPNRAVLPVAQAAVDRPALRVRQEVPPALLVATVVRVVRKEELRAVPARSAVGKPVVAKPVGVPWAVARRVADRKTRAVSPAARAATHVHHSACLLQEAELPLGEFQHPAWTCRAAAAVALQDLMLRVAAAAQTPRAACLAAARPAQVKVFSRARAARPAPRPRVRAAVPAEVPAALRAHRGGRKVELQERKAVPRDSPVPRAALRVPRAVKVRAAAIQARPVLPARRVVLKDLMPPVLQAGLPAAKAERPEVARKQTPQANRAALQVLPEMRPDRQATQQAPRVRPAEHLAVRLARAVALEPTAVRLDKQVRWAGLRTGRTASRVLPQTQQDRPTAQGAMAHRWAERRKPPDPRTARAVCRAERKETAVLQAIRRVPRDRPQVAPAKPKDKRARRDRVRVQPDRQAA